MLRIWQKTEKQTLEPVGMGTAFPFLKEKNHVVSIIGGGGKTTLLYEMAGFCVKNDQKVLVTTSTHIYRPPKEWHDQSLEAVELTLGESGRRLPLIDPLLGLAGIQARQRLPLGDACPLTNI